MEAEATVETHDEYHPRASHALRGDGRGFQHRLRACDQYLGIASWHAKFCDLGALDLPKRSPFSSNRGGERKAGRIPDQLLFVEHPARDHMGRNGHAENLLAGEDVLSAPVSPSLYRPRRRCHLSWPRTNRRLSYPRFARMEARRGGVFPGDRTSDNRRVG